MKKILLISLFLTLINTYAHASDAAICQAVGRESEFLIKEYNATLTAYNSNILKIDKILKPFRRCQERGLLYVPSHPESNAQGCLDTSVLVGPQGPRGPRGDRGKC